jgi:murE/murF fusion protein
MLLGKLLKLTNKKYRKIRVNSISFDSRKIKKKDIFFAIKGNQTSGTKFIKDAISKGASIIVSDKKTKYKNHKTPYLLVKDVRKSLAEASSNFYKKKPSNIIAVTGTNGKSSVANFFYQILSFNKISAASIGTLGIFSKNYSKKINLTSMDPLSLHKNLQILARNKVNHVILEASSHGLDQKRLDNLNIKTGIFTNFSQDHLDYHKNMKSYFNSKMYLFKNLLNKNSKIITDEENKEFKIIKNIANKRKIKKITIGSNSRNIKILYNKYKQNKQIVKISVNSKIFLLKTPLIGYFQIKNLLMAILAASSCGLNQNKIFNQINKIKPVSGRLECVAHLNNNSNIIVDFAHTPDALEQSLIALKKQFKKEIVIVFGCGGERDKKKRLIMGKVAKKYCRKIFVTDDNPRNEDPEKIRNMIMKGCKKLAINIGNRKQAIKTAIKELGSNEILLVAGKGHEKTQDYGNKIINFSDKKVIVEIIKKRKYSIKKSNWSNLLAKKVFKNNSLNDVNYSGVSINTKNIKKNNLFFAIRGKKNDGHKFVKEAFKKGAIRSIVSTKKGQPFSNKIIKVKNTFSSLNDLAKVTRDATSAQIIGITGSTGKTTLKNLIGFALKNYGKVYYSPHSYNNKFGVPLSLSNLKSNTEYGVFEIGMDKKGEINNLSKIVKPEIAIITNISEAHIKNFNTLKDIAKAKSEIIDNISKDGNVILNRDDKFFRFLSNKAKKRGIRVISFSSKQKANISLLESKMIKNYYRLKIIVKNKIFYFNTKYSTNNFISNILACISVLSVLNLDLKNMKNKFANFSIPNGRGDIKIVKKFQKKFKFIDESYNANPLSMSSAIQNMNYYKREGNVKKLVFLGDMLELGKKSKKLHKKLSIIINKSDIDKVFVYGKHIKETFNLLSRNKKGKVFNNLKEAYDHFNKIVHNNDLLMVKGSNATGLNQFSKNIKRGYISAI